MSIFLQQVAGRECDFGIFPCIPGSREAVAWPRYWNHRDFWHGEERGDICHLLIQGAHAIMRSGRNTPLRQLGWKLFAFKGNRNVAVALGATLRTGIGLGKTLEDSVKTLLSRCQPHPEPSASPCETPQPA